eukprot:344324-Rhodomonas_salina.2
MSVTVCWLHGRAYLRSLPWSVPAIASRNWTPAERSRSALDVVSRMRDTRRGATRQDRFCRRERHEGLRTWHHLLVVA